MENKKCEPCKISCNNCNCFCHSPKEEKCKHKNKSSGLSVEFCSGCRTVLGEAPELQKEEKCNINCNGRVIRDIQESCTIHSNSPQESFDWEEKFDEEFSTIFKDLAEFNVDRGLEEEKAEVLKVEWSNDIKSFIKTLLSSEQAKWEKEQQKELDFYYKNGYVNGHQDGEKQARTQLLEEIREKMPKKKDYMSEKDEHMVQK